MEHMRKEGIQCASHYPPLHLSSMGKRWNYKRGDVPITEDLSGRLLRLPFHNELKKEEQEEICACIAENAARW